MGFKGKMILAAISITIVANYSKVLRSSMVTVRRSVGTVELTRIDKCLRQHHLMKMADAGTYGTGYFFPKSQAEFQAVLSDSFDTPGRDPTLDNWGNPLQYKRFKDGFLLVSLGADGKRNTDDDLWLERHGKKVAMSRGLSQIQQDLIGQIDKVAKAQKEAVEALQKAAAEAKRSSPPPPDEEPTPPASGTRPTPKEPLPPGPPRRGRPGTKGAARRGRPPREQERAPTPPKLSPKRERKAKYLLSAAENMRLNNLDGKARKYYQRLVADFGDTTYGRQAAEALKNMPE